ncbi:hypothetical protein ACNOYE_05620 [Nannocystaceae bacterium ST9]
MTIADKLLDEGRAKGRIEGRVEGRIEGRVEGAASVLSKLLGLKFGELPELYRARLAQARPDELDAWTDRVLTAATLEQVFAD